jgi:heterodisulfide reductase subunit B/heterodisulfide reductase subunit C
MSELFYFWGCQIPARIPFIERSIRLLMVRLGYEVGDIPGFTCCPEEALVQSLGEDVWELTALRNLANAERHQRGAVLITPCNGCSSTFKSVAARMEKNPQRLAEMNRSLEEVGLHYEGTVRVVHLVEFLHDIVGKDRLKDKIEFPLAGMRIATHPGCRFSSPSEAVSFDQPLDPVTLDVLVSAAGAELIDYSVRRLCCGQDLANTGHMEDSLQLLRHKVLAAQNEEADALCVSCPACFIQFDHRQSMLAKQGEHLSTPVFFVSELLGLSLGITPEDLSLSDHRVGTDGFLKKWHENLNSYLAAAEIVDLALVRDCVECGACVNDCPSALVTPGFEPHAILRQLLEGKIEQALREAKFWYCMQCRTCYELCPQRFGMDTVFRALRALAVRRGEVPAGIKTGLEYFEKKALLGEPAERQRRKLGLDALPQAGAAELAKILEKIKGRK